LNVISNDTYNTNLKGIKITNYPWNALTVNADIIKADIVLNPRLNTGKWKYKSNNKTVHAWALGMPVAHTDKELDALASKESREKESKEKLELVKNEYDVLLSVKQYQDLINEIYKHKANSEVKPS